MARWRQQKGKEGEVYAAEVLKKKGWKIVAFGYRTPFGEIDLVCEDQEEIVFVEVKTRTSTEFGYPEEAVTPAKVRHMQKSAHWILQKEQWMDRPWRLDVMAIIIKSPGHYEHHHIFSIDIHGQS